MKKNILITGASGGIGRDVALQLARYEECAIITISRNEDQLNNLADIINADDTNNSQIIPLAFDLTNNDFSKIIAKVKELGTLDILINNAAILINKEITEISDKAIREMFETNFFAPLRLIKSLIPFMSGTGKAHIVNIGSMGGFQGSIKFPGMSSYSASKAALANITEGLAVELAKFNISVNCLAIGSVQTEMLRAAFPEYKAPLSSVEMADYIIDFALTGHKYFNGKIIPVALSTP